MFKVFKFQLRINCVSFVIQMRSKMFVLSKTPPNSLFRGAILRAAGLRGPLGRRSDKLSYILTVLDFKNSNLNFQVIRRNGIFQKPDLTRNKRAMKFPPSPKFSLHFVTKMKCTPPLRGNY